MPMPNITIHNAHEYVYRNSAGHEWTVAPATARDCMYNQLTYTYLGRRGGGVWNVSPALLQTYAVRRVDGTIDKTGVLGKIEQLEKRFAQRKVAYGTS